MFVLTWCEPSVYFAAFLIIVCPLYWNYVARWEHRTDRVSDYFGSPFKGFVCFTLSVILLSFCRDWRYLQAIKNQSRWFALQQNSILWLGYFLIILGSSLNLCTLCSLGIKGAYFGEFFGFLLPRKLQSFPFNIVEHGFYVGTVLLYLGLALVSASQAGLMLTFLLAIVYRISYLYERPYMEDMYRPHRRVKRVTDEIHWETVQTMVS
ncbi:hypothetical protein NP493_182g04003 [Ridgeia piscesae]|uniref:Phosphatidylethanolamine N-methyltransferase n=1 Tax=Ridgeia piscesae TaxID=27915 RepID=A0AAD9P2G8_RIDPI|nr:hypothetical protein NP493_182g04003 [Ridgeia piscesae]